MRIRTDGKFAYREALVDDVFQSAFSALALSEGGCHLASSGVMDTDEVESNLVY